MDRKPLTPRQSKFLVVFSLIVFAAALVAASISEYWLLANPSAENVLNYNRWLTVIPQSLSTAATVMLALGLTQYSRKYLFSAISTGIALSAVTLVMMLKGFFAITINEQLLGYSYLPSGPLLALFIIGTGATIAGIIGFAFRGWYGKGKSPADHV